MVDARSNLDRLIAEHDEDYASISRLIGRNAAYIQQFIHRGSPRRLAERDRQVIARYFGIDERLLGGPDPDAHHGSAHLRVPRYDIGASAGGGARPDSEHTYGAHGFEPSWLRSHGWQHDRLSMIRVEGDSMEPALSHGDELLVERQEEMRRDGIYVLRLDGELLVKRLARAPGGRLAIRSDNAAYPSWENVDAALVEIIGRVLWVGRVL